VSSTPDYLAESGSAFILGSWVHTSEQSWEQRVVSWFPSTGVSAWVLQRDVVDPALYVSTWLKDESVDPRSTEGIARTRQWLAHFREEDVRAVGFGWIFIRDIGEAPTEVTTETLSQPFTDPLGPEVEEYFVRMEWLRETSESGVLDAHFALRPGVALEDISLTNTETGMGFAPEVKRITRTDGPRFSHEIDDTVAAIIAGLNPDGLPLCDIVSLWAASHGLDDDAEEALCHDAAAVVVDLIRHGFVLPADIVSLNS